MPDPRRHRHVVSVDSYNDRHLIHYVCNCINEIDAPTGILRSVAKCPGHVAEQRDPVTLGESYYEGLGLIKNGKPTRTNHVAELVEALGEIPYAPSVGSTALEIGCGASPYAMTVIEKGYWYCGVEPSTWAAQWMRDTYDAKVEICSFENFKWRPACALILAAHCLEHMADVSAALAKIAGLLIPDGQVWIVVPDDEDPINPDHIWFFNEDTLARAVESAGLVIDAMTKRRHVPQESFLYVQARKIA